jgi:RimJ/RimL family protein N-acetyltransferase
MVASTALDAPTVAIRAMRADDADALVRFHAGLSPDTVYLWFFSVHPELSDAEVDRFTHVDHRDREALVAVADGEIVGVARLDRCATETEAEVAFVIADAWQGKGLGTRLFHALAARGRELGVQRFVAETLPQNRRMLALFSHAGLPVSTSMACGVVTVSLEL